LTIRSFIAGPFHGKYEKGTQSIGRETYKRKKPFRKAKRKWDIIKGSNKQDMKNMVWINLTGNRDQILVNVAIDLGVPLNCGNFFNA
jgi:hypothetical protein